MLITTLYLLNTAVSLCVAYAAIDPGGCRRVLQTLGLWPLVERMDSRRTRQLLGGIGKLLMVAGGALGMSVLLGHHSTAWLLPAGEAAFLGFIAWLSAYLGEKR